MFIRNFLFAVMQHHLSESDDIPPSPISPLAPPLPEGAVVASEKRMVIVRPQPRSLDGSQSRLNSVELVESTRRHKVQYKFYYTAINYYYCRVIINN